jgi:hypothetical protein
MWAKHRSSRHDGRSGFIATAAVVVLIVGGLGLIGIAIASQRQAQQPPVAAGGPEPAATAADSAGSGTRTTIPVASRTRSGRGSSEVVGPTLSRSTPVSLDIPSIDVSSVVQDLGQTADGALETPAPGPHYDEAAWYRYSPTPGSLGPAIILGHVDSAADGPSVFFRLSELQPGDRVMVTRADDSVAVFIVDDVKRYAKDDFPTKIVYGDINHAGLRILTCGGAFDTASGHYLDNIVVFASLTRS